MEHLEYHMDLLNAVVTAVILDSFPDEADLLPIIWPRFVEKRKAAPNLGSVGLPAIEGGQEDFSAPFVIMTVAAVIESLPETINRPDTAAIGTAVQQAAHSLGLRGPRLRHVVESVTPKLVRAFALIGGSPTLDSTKPSSKSSFAPSPPWVEWWHDGQLDGLVTLAHEAVIHDERTLRAMLTIDECSGQLLGPRVSLSFLECSPRGLIGVWLAIDRAGQSFGLDDVDELRVDPKRPVEERALRKYIIEGRQILMKVIDQEIIPKSRKGKYYVPRIGWSWCWIRENEDRAKSELLG